VCHPLLASSPDKPRQPQTSPLKSPWRGPHSCSGTPLAAHLLQISPKTAQLPHRRQAPERSKYREKLRSRNAAQILPRPVPMGLRPNAKRYEPPESSKKFRVAPPNPRSFPVAARAVTLTILGPTSRTSARVRQTLLRLGIWPQPRTLVLKGLPSIALQSRH
jgi:hypothetical protein